MKLDLLAQWKDVHWVQELHIYFSEVPSHFIFKYDLQSYKWTYLVNGASFIKLFELVNFNSKTFNVIIDLSNMVKLRWICSDLGWNQHVALQKYYIFIQEGEVGEESREDSYWSLHGYDCLEA